MLTNSTLERERREREREVKNSHMHKIDKFNHDAMDFAEIPRYSLHHFQNNCCTNEQFC